MPKEKDKTQINIFLLLNLKMIIIKKIVVNKIEKIRFHRKKYKPNKVLIR